MNQLIGRYQILKEIASGGQGAVYLAFDPELGDTVALKVLRPDLTGDATYLERFRREANMAAAIDHPNVIRILEVGEDNGRQFIALEFLPESLAGLIQSGGPMEIDRAVELAIQIAEGLAAAHNLGIVHRDVKPQNVLIGHDGAAKVTDFGIARAESLDTMTQTGALLGTPHYMSPEQARGETVDVRSDVYSLRCVLYQMLTGELPFKGTTPLVVLRQHIEEQPRPIRQARRQVGQELVSVVERAMAKNPARRYQTASEMAAALRAALEGAERRRRRVRLPKRRPSDQDEQREEDTTPSDSTPPSDRGVPGDKARTPGAPRFIYGAALGGVIGIIVAIVVIVVWFRDTVTEEVLVPIEKVVPVEVIKEVPVDKIVEVPVIIEKEVVVEKEVIREVEVEVPVIIEKEVIREVEVEVPVIIVKEVVKEVEAERIVEVIKEVPVEVVKIVEVEVVREVPVEVVVVKEVIV